MSVLGIDHVQLAMPKGRDDRAHVFDPFGNRLELMEAKHD